MMKPLIVLIALLAGCADTGYNSLAPNTAPGAELPSRAFDICDQTDGAGLCTKWRYGSGVVKPL